MLPVHFAPLQGYTDAPYRSEHAAIFGGVDVYYTPFIRIERGTFRTRDLRNLSKAANVGFRLIPQIIASNAEECRTLVDLVAQNGYNEVDINMGCPFPMITSKRKGSGILPSPELVNDVLQVIENYNDINFSLKMRLGQFNFDECLNLLPVINKSRLQHITLHPRIGTQQYKGDCNMEMFKQFYEGCKHSIVYNGDVCSIADFQRIEAQFPKLAAIMVGRGLLANPALAQEYRSGETLQNAEYMKKVRLFHANLLTYYEANLNGESQILEKMRSLWEYLLPNGDKKCKKKIAKTTSLRNYKVYVDDMLR